MKRRDFLKAGAGAAALISASQRVHAALVQTPLAGRSIPQWIDPLPLLDLAGGPMQTVIAGSSEVEMHMREFRANVMPSTFVPVVPPGAPPVPYLGTYVWGYVSGSAFDPAVRRGTYIGPVVVAARGTPTQVRYINNLGQSNADMNVITWFNATDQTLHWANPLNTPMIPNNPAHYVGPIPAVPHLHGGEVPPVLDGGPDSWFTSDGVYHGHAYYTMSGAAGNEAIYRYPNVQEAAPIWFHDHALGITRLNVYAGLAGAYIVTDPNLTLPAGLNPVGLQQGNDPTTVEYVIPLVLQDRSFDTNGQLLIPNLGINPQHPYWIPEFVGDTIAVNGKVWPFLNVQPRRYRFLFINGSNARTYELFIAGGPPMWQIETDGGYLDAPVRTDSSARLTLMPGERAGVIIDFSAFAGQTLIMRNTGRTPYPKGTPPQGSTVGRIIQFRVGAPVPGFIDASYDPATLTPLRPPMIRLVNPATGTLAPGVTVQKTRQLTLNEVMGPGGPLEILLNNSRWNGLRGDGTVRTDFMPVTVGGDTEYFSELPAEGETEVWEIVNLTADAHPIHTHLTQFQLMSRQNFNVNRYNAAYAAAFTATGYVYNGITFPPGTYMPAFGPPLNYNTGNPRALGGNPDITPFLQGRPAPPAPNEAGWKDTVLMYPGQVTKIVIRYAPTDEAITDPNLAYPFDPNAPTPNGPHGYVWHCHIIDHEDNEMMRPLLVNPKAGAARTYVQGVDY